MYELKCPSCGQVLRASFVRAGAVTDCPRCAHRYRIKESQLTRKVPAAATGAGGKSALLPAAKELASMAGARLRVDDEGNVIGLSGLSEMMRHEGVGASRPRRTAKPGEDDPDAAPPPGRLPRSRPAPRPLSQPRTLYVLACTLCLGLAVVGVALWHASTLPPGGTAAEGRLANLPMILGVQMSHEPWERPDAPYERSADPDEHAEGIRLTDTNLGMPVNGEPVLTASVVSSRSDVVTRARVHLSLVDQAGIEVARTQVDAALIARGHRYRMRLPVPSDLAGQWLSVSARVELLDTVPEGRFMEGAVAVPMARGSVRGVRLLAANSGSDPMRRMMFLVTALDADDQPIRRWRATWNRPTGPGQPIECQLIIPGDLERGVERWQVRMMGEPMRPLVAEEAGGDEPGEPADESPGADEP